MTPLDDTRHCPMCEDAAKKILELKQRVKVLSDALRVIMDDQHAEENRYVFLTAKQALNKTPQQTAEQIERGHTEWMMKLPVAGEINLTDRRHGMRRSYCLSSLGNLPLGTKLVAIPPFPKESNSPETDLEEWLRRQ